MPVYRLCFIKAIKGRSWQSKLLARQKLDLLYFNPCSGIRHLRHTLSGRSKSPGQPTLEGRELHAGCGHQEVGSLGGILAVGMQMNMEVRFQHTHWQLRLNHVLYQGHPPNLV